MWLFYLLWISTHVMAQRPGSGYILRYSTSSCESLIPTATKEDFTNFNLGQEPEPEPEAEAEPEDDEETFQEPKELNARNPPFNLVLDFTKYRRGKMYEVKITAEETYDSFLIQMRGRDKNNNITYVGEWIKIPHISKTISCVDGYSNDKATVIDKGRPIRLSNITFTWKAPDRDVGIIRAVASVAYNNFYQRIYSREIPFEPFPVSVSDCGSSKGCARLCDMNDSKCRADSANYLVTFGVDGKSDASEPEIEFKLGGTLSSNKSDYVALGIGSDYYNLKNMDIVICSRDNNNVDIAHYFLEDKNSKPYEHRSRLRLIDFGIDSESGLSWCTYVRPQRPETELDLDLTEKLYHFYFRGHYSNDTSIMLPPLEEIQKSGYRFNITDAYDEIRMMSQASLEIKPLIMLNVLLTMIVMIYM